MNLKSISVIAFVFLSSVTTFAQVKKYDWKEANEGGYTYRYVTNDPTNSRFYTLKNGLTVILSPSKKVPRIQAYIATKAGSKTDPADHTGLAHYLEHMLFKGTDKFGSKDWAKENHYLIRLMACMNNIIQRKTNLSVKKSINKSIRYLVRLLNTQSRMNTISL